MDVLTELEANCSALWNSSGILAGTGAGPIVGVPGDLGPWYCVYEWCIVLASKQGMQPIWMIHWEMGNGSLPLVPAWKILWRSHHPAKSSHTKHILNLHGSKLTPEKPHCDPIYSSLVCFLHLLGGYPSLWQSELQSKVTLLRSQSACNGTSYALWAALQLMNFFKAMIRYRMPFK